MTINHIKYGLLRIYQNNKAEIKQFIHVNNKRFLWNY